MPKKSAVKKSRVVKKKTEGDGKIRMMLRFANSDQHELICRAKDRSGLPSLNAFIIQALVKEARRQLKD